jgi:hypothetical protein
MSLRQVLPECGEPTGRYVAEILRNEGFNAFDVIDLSALDVAALASHRLVILGEMPIHAAQVMLLSDWCVARHQQRRDRVRHRGTGGTAGPGVGTHCDARERARDPLGPRCRKPRAQSCTEVARGRTSSAGRRAASASPASLPEEAAWMSQCCKRDGLHAFGQREAR